MVMGQKGVNKEVVMLERTEMKIVRIITGVTQR